MPSRTDLSLGLFVCTVFFLAGRFAGGISVSEHAALDSQPPHDSQQVRKTKRQTVDRVARRRRLPVLTPTIKVSSNAEWLSLQDEYPQETNAISNAIVMERSRLLSEQEKNPYDCNVGGELIGKYVLEFRVAIESTRNKLRAHPWRFVGVRSGAPLSESVVRCYEQLLARSTIEIEDEGRFLDGFTGDVPVLYRIDFGTPDLQDLEPEERSSHSLNLR